MSTTIKPCTLGWPDWVARATDDQLQAQRDSLIRHMDADRHQGLPDDPAALEALDTINSEIFRRAPADIDPALYGLPQDSEIGPEVYGGGTAARELDRIRRALEGLEGEAYLWRAEELLAEAGFVYTGTHCTCAHEGENGHDFDCGYTYRPVHPTAAGWDVAELGPEQAKTAQVTREIEDQLVGKALAELDPMREARP